MVLESRLHAHTIQPTNQCSSVNMRFSPARSGNISKLLHTFDVEVVAQHQGQNNAPREVGGKMGAQFNKNTKKIYNYIYIYYI